MWFWRSQGIDRKTIMNIQLYVLEEKLQSVHSSDLRHIQRVNKYPVAREIAKVELERRRDNMQRTSIAASIVIALMACITTVVAVIGR